MHQQIQESEQLGYVCGSEDLTAFITHNFSIINIIIFETTGSIGVAYIITYYGGFLNFPMNQTYYSSGVCAITYFILYFWSGRFCGATLNPSLTLAHIFKNQRSVSFVKGAVYLLCQIGGMIAGVVIGYLQLSGTSPAVTVLQLVAGNSTWWKILIQNICGGFVFILIVLIMVSSDISFVQVDLQIWFTIVFCYATTAMLTNNSFGPNFILPLIASLFGWVYGHVGIDAIRNSWPVVVGNLVGTLLGIGFFEFIYRKFVEVLIRQLRQEKQLKKIQGAERERRGTAIEMV